MSNEFASTDVINFFSSFSGANNMGKQEIKKGLYISTKCRRDLMLGASEGKIIVSGEVHEFKFKNLGGGVWHVTLEDL